jgi:hypothetical protein
MRTIAYALLVGLAVATIGSRAALAAPMQSYTPLYNPPRSHPPQRSPAYYSPNQVPEIDPIVGLRLIGLLGGAVIVIRGRAKA